VSRATGGATIRTTPLVLAVGALCAVAVPAAAQDSLIQRPLIKGLAFRGNRGLDDYALAISIVTTNSSWWVRSPLVSWIGMGQRRYFDEREFRRDVLRLKLLYSQAGYPDAVIDTTVHRDDGQVRLAFHITEGLPIRVTELTVSGVQDVIDSAALRRQLPLERGAPFNRLLFGAATDSIRATLQDRGYPFPEVFRGFSVDREARRASVSFDVVPGPQARYGPLEIQGTARVTEAAVARLVPLRPGRQYRRRDLIDAQRDLYASGAFDYADVRLADSAGPNGTDSTVRALVRVREGRFHRVRAAPGYGTEDCFRVLLGLSAANAWGNLRRLDVTARFSKIGTGDPFGWGLENSLCRALQDDDPERRALNYNVSASLSDPAFLGRMIGGAVSVFVERQSEIEAYVREGFGLETSLTFRFLRATPVTLSYELGRATTKASPASTCFYLNVCRADDIEAYQQPRRDAILGLVVLRNRQNSVLNPTRGSFTSAEIRWASPLIGADSLAAFTKLQGQHARYHRIGRGMVLSWRVAAGTLMSSGVRVDGEQQFYVPPEQRFYGGGATTVRGYGQNELGPVVRVIDSVPENGGVRVDTLSSASGGTDHVLANVELRVPFPGFGGRVEGALFVDAGQVFDREDEVTDPGLRVTPGLGLRFVTGIGPIRFDVGYNGYPPRAGPLYVEQSNGDLTPDPSNPTYAPEQPTSLLSRLRLHFSVGQAF
jgi:outer membrane protein assembly factor BamA